MYCTVVRYRVFPKKYVCIDYSNGLWYFLKKIVITSNLSLN